MPATRPLRIGLVGDACDPLTGRCLDGMVAYARFHDAISIVDLRTSCNGHGQEPDELPAWLGKVDGLVLGSPRGKPSQPLAWSRLLDVPRVSLQAEPPDGRHAVVDVDPDQVASLAVDHLLDIGVASFLHVGVANCPGSNRRAQGFVRVLAARGRTATLHDCTEPVVGDLGDARRLVEESRLGDVLAPLPKPVGLLSLDDRIAKGCVFACQALGLAVPGDVAVVGVGDSPDARHAVPTITSVRIPYESLAARATAMLCGMIREERPGGPRPEVEQVAIDRILPRESTIGSDGKRLGRWLDRLDHVEIGDSAIPRIAGELGVSRRTFERQFLRLVGHSPAEEIRRRRLERAKELLDDQSVPIAEVAGRVGFTPAAFSRFFRRQTGSTPREYREASAERLLGRAVESSESDGPSAATPGG